MARRVPDWHLSDAMLGRSAEALAKAVKVDQRYDVPYLAGYSVNGKRIYLDRRIPATLTLPNGRRLRVARYLVVHEAVEKALLRCYGLRYQHAHQIALRAERELIKADGYTWADYDRVMRAWAKLAEDDRPLKLPPDLDLTPYRDSGDREMLSRMAWWRRRG
jgi:hypothetical protein